MSLPALAANGAWVASNLRAWTRFRQALRDPEGAQRDVLNRLLSAQRTCDYARRHGLDEFTSYEAFARQVPLNRYEDLEPQIHRIARGEDNVLCASRVTRLMPTSGSTGGRKLIPFTAALQEEFTATIGPWIVDLGRRHPPALRGPAYWSVSPAIPAEGATTSTVPIGFEDDSEYLGGMGRRLVNVVMAAPPALRHIQDTQVFRALVLLYLLRAEHLSLVSVWHPSFLTLLLDALPAHWDRLVHDVRSGGFHLGDRLPKSLSWLPSTLHPRPARADRLGQAGPADLEHIWPRLSVVSAWGDAQAVHALTALQARLPHVTFQPKGLLSTEAFVTLPFGGTHPLAVRSHLFEFIDANNQVVPLGGLRNGGVYEVVVTTGGGLWRYRTGDAVEVTGLLERCPTLRFVGRVGRVSDLRGEKLTDAFVGRVLQEVLRSSSRDTAAPGFAMLAPEAEGGVGVPHYALYVEGMEPAGLAGRLDFALRENPHYALCRDLGQLGAVRCVPVGPGAQAAYLEAEAGRGIRLGDIKPVALSHHLDWGRRLGSPAPAAQRDT